MAGPKGAPGDPKHQGDTEVVTRTERRTKRPPLYKVLFHNDDFTTMEFVVMVLMDVFHHGEAAATAIMLAVHHKGVGVAGVFPKEIAENKAQKAMALAREHEFP